MDGVGLEQPGEASRDFLLDGAGVDVPLAEEVNLAFQDVERLVPIVPMRRRASAFRALLHG